MSKPIMLISYQEYLDSCAAKCHYNGSVYVPNGLLLEVEDRQQMSVTDRPDFPFNNSIYYTKGTRFLRREHVTKISVVDLEGLDFVFDMGGNFIETKPENDPNRKGQIYIRQVKMNRNVTKIESDIFEYVAIQDMKNMLTPEAYSRIFTHVIGLLMRDDLKLIRNQVITVQRVPATSYVKKRNIHNMTEGEWNENLYALAFHKLTTYNDHIVTAIVRGHNASNTNLEFYSTIWNILNLLGAHELTAHTVISNLNDAYGTHFLAYGYQMKHETWKHTTQKFKEDTRDGFHKLYNDSREDEKRNKESGIYPWLKRKGLFQSDYHSRRTDSLFYQNRISPEVRDTSVMKGWSEELKQFPKLENWWE